MSTGKILFTGCDGDIGSILFNMYKKIGHNFDPLDVNVALPAKRIIHLAACAPPDSNQKIVNSNISYLQEIIEYAEKNQVQEIIFFSSISVYGKQCHENVNEDDKLNSPDLYGLTKLIGEKLLQESQINVLCLRLPAILGYRNTTTFMSKCFEKLKNNQTLCISDANRIYNNLISTENLFEFLKNVELKQKFDIINLSSKKGKTVLEIVELIKSALNSRSEIIITDNTSHFFNISSKKAQYEYGFIPFEINEAINSWVRKRLDKTRN